MKKAPPIEDAGDRGDAGRKPVDVVEQIERVRDADHPEDREQGVDDGRSRERDRRQPVDD